MTYLVLLTFLGEEQSIRNIKKFTLMLRKVDKINPRTEGTPGE